jgi:transposase
MSKYSFEFKLKVVKEYMGEEGLERKSSKTFYSGEFKLRVLQYRQYHNCSYRKEKDTLNLTKSEKEELIELREENEFLRASLAYEKKLKALIQERESKTKKRRK